MSEPGSGVSIVGVDTGGTFTDVVARVGGELRVLKLPSTPEDPARAVLDGIRRIVPEGGRFLLVHGSTVATNTLLERTGARVALVTNRGFEDIIEIGRQNRPQLYALVGHRPEPLVAREDRHGIAGRLGPTGDEEEPLDPDELQALGKRLQGAESIAVCLLHAYADPMHEDRVAEALAGAGLPLSASSRLLPEYREYERTATTVVNAYVAPRMERYLGRVERDSGADRVRIMGSGGGAMSVARARREAVRTVLSGPAGGVAGAMRAAAEAGITDILTFDMGGTSTDVSLCPGGPLHTRELVIAGLPIAVPVLDIHTVGAGGGSVAWLDAGGALRVGPRSAGAHPGPICYGRGGTEVTVTDVHVWLHRLPPGVFLGGEQPLDRDAIAGPLRALADRLGNAPEDAAEGILAVADTAMEGALRVISVERGHDPLDFTLVPFGGAAGLHAVELAERLGVRRLFVPADPGLLSAVGMVVSPVRKEVSRTVLIRGEESEAARVAEVYRELEAAARAEMSDEGVADDDIRIRRLADVRYAGQSFELRVPADGWADAFHATHQARYGFARPGAAVELVTARVEAVGPEPTLPEAPRGTDSRLATQPTQARQPARPTPGEDLVPVRYRGEEVGARVVARSDLGMGNAIEGPAIIHEYSATVWLPPGWRADAAGRGGMAIRRSLD